MGFDTRESKHTLYRWEDFMKKFCSSLIKHATNAINFEKEKMLLLTKKEPNLHQDVTECRKKFANDKNYWKFKDHCYFAGK